MKNAWHRFIVGLLFATIALAAGGCGTEFYNQFLSFGGANAVSSSNHNIEVWLTAPAERKWLAHEPDLTIGRAMPANARVITVDPDTHYQQMQGFGATITESSAWLMTQLPEPVRQRLLFYLFDRKFGIGLNLLREPMGASDFALGRYTYDDRPDREKDPNLHFFSVAPDEKYLMPVLRQAIGINPALHVMGNPWSPPAWMKSNNSLIGGHLNADAYASYADYFVHYIQAYAVQGIPITAVTPQNEPFYAPPDSPGMLMTTAEEASFAANYLAPALKRAGLAVQIFLGDDNWNHASQLIAMFNDPAARQAARGVAFHAYAGEPSAMAAFHAAYPGKAIWITEASGEATGRSLEDGLRFDMEKLIIGGPRNWASAVIKWNVALDESHGPHIGGCQDCTGLFTIKTATGTMNANYDYYALGQASKFVQPGAWRVESNEFGANDINDVAFENPGGQIVLIVFNANNAPQNIVIRCRGDRFAYSLAAGSAASFIWRPRVRKGPSVVTPPGEHNSKPAPLPPSIPWWHSFGGNTFQQ